jgi:polyhydroxybutyrate depolymerase
VHRSRRASVPWLACAIGAALAMPACGGAQPADPTPSGSASAGSTVESGRVGPGTHRLHLTWDGTERSYLLYVPRDYDPVRRPPLVIALHPYPGTGEEMRAMAGLDAKADEEGFIVAYPDGVGSGFNALICCGTEDDAGFLQALADHLVERWRGDPDRVYLTGISNGGDMSFRAAVEAAGTFAAIGVVSGGFIGPRAADPGYAPKRPVSVVTIIGADDRYAGQFQEGIATWRSRLRCTGDRARRLRGQVAETVSRCADGSDVVSYVVPGMGHAWPGATTGALADPDAPIRATDVVWKFFEAHPRRR